MPRITAQISEHLYEKIEQSSKDMMFDSKSEVINYYLQRGYKLSGNRIDDERIPDSPRPSTETLRAVTKDIDYIIEILMKRIDTSQERAVKIIELNGIIPIALIGLVFKPSRPSNEYPILFYIGILLFVTSIVLAVVCYLKAGRIRQNLGLNQEDFDDIVINEEANEGEYLWLMLKKIRYPFLENVIESTQAVNRMILLSVILFVFGLVILGSEIIVG